MPIPITIITGFLGSGKTTLILNLIPQLPQSYKLALLKNEFGDLAVDSQLASSAAIAGVRELLNGCICCNLVGQLGEALEELRHGNPGLDRIVIETSGSAHPATLVLEVNRLARESGGTTWVLDGVVSVVDVENWRGYEDTSYTARMQAQFTDLIVLNKWEAAGERRVEDVLDRIGDLELEVACVRSEMGKVDCTVLLGLDGKLAGRMLEEDDERKAEAEATGRQDGSEKGSEPASAHAAHAHFKQGEHQSEVEVLSLNLPDPSHGKSLQQQRPRGVDLSALHKLLLAAPKNEIYRIKALLVASTTPTSSDDPPTASDEPSSSSSPTELATTTLRQYILNWAFGRWVYTLVANPAAPPMSGEKEGERIPALRMTIVTARGEAEKWRKRIVEKGYIVLEKGWKDGSDDEAAPAESKTEGLEVRIQRVS